MVVQVERKESSHRNEITKAAAWAWYERGSWSESKTIKESDFRRQQDYTPRPSRYKIEAMKESQNKCYDNSLLDMYEIERISRELHGYVESSKVAHRSRSIDGGDHGGRSIASKETKSKSTGKKDNRGWRRYGVVCGSSREDVVEHVLLVGGRRQRNGYRDGRR